MRVAGKNPSGNELKIISISQQFDGKIFKNSSKTPMMSEDASYFKMLKYFFKMNPDKVPQKPVPVVETNLLENQFAKPVINWFGHSSYLLRVEGKRILVDPVFSGNASPVSFMVSAFEGTNRYGVADMPEIDYLILTHDHYDHLDYKTILALKGKVKKIYCSLGVGSHLRYWGYEASMIHEIDWWQEQEMEAGFKITALPARHFSGRGIKRCLTLWSSFLLQTPNFRIYLGGDSGYDNHFIEIGKRFQDIDIAILECGQYNSMWPLIHMMPEETVQAAVDLKAKQLLPVHWGKFALALHSWNEPIQRAVIKAKELDVNLQMPRIGESLVVGETKHDTAWWEL